MTVYVDNMRAQLGRMVMCHMLADTTDELLAMADKIGVNRKWIQSPGTPREHFDIALTKRAEAVKHGAVEITMSQAGAIVRRKREAPQVSGMTTPPTVLHPLARSMAAIQRHQLPMDGTTSGAVERRSLPRGGITPAPAPWGDGTQTEANPRSDDHDDIY